jgi:hypothetical protein
VDGVEAQRRCSNGKGILGAVEKASVHPNRSFDLSEIEGTYRSDDHR